MKIQSLPKEMLVEILHYMADYERLEGLEQILHGDFSILDVRAAMRELAVQLRDELGEERQADGVSDAQGISHLSAHTKKILSGLSPREEKALLRVFKLVEGVK